jgi:diadenosine tetraphosphate (Ap4A) HIT family hydrolase
MVCPFDHPPVERIFYEDELIRCIWDAFPVSEGHALVITCRHVPTWFDATAEEKDAITRGIDIARREIEKSTSPDGYNVGFNAGEAAGQTVFHLHVHVIPRLRGDVEDPRGGVRQVIPAKVAYWEPAG